MTTTPDPRTAHDHTDTRPFGYDKDLQPIPAWWFNCPRCGTAESEVHLVRWNTAVGEWLTANAGFKGSAWFDEPQEVSAA